MRGALVGAIGLSIFGILAGAAVRGNEAMYLGGTSSGIPEKTLGHLELGDEHTGKFVSKKGEISIPYARISSLEYGQKVGRRVGVAIAVNPVFLLSKKRKHFLTVGYEDDQGSKQGAVFEISKGNVREIVTTLEDRSGKKVEFESEDARKQLEKQSK